MKKLTIEFKDDEWRFAKDPNMADSELFFRLLEVLTGVSEDIMQFHNCGEAGCHLKALTTEILAAIHSTLNLHNLGHE